MDRVLLSFGPITIYTFGFTIALGILAGLYVIHKQSNRLGFNTDSLLEMVIVVLLAGIIGARLFFVAFYQPGYYLAHPGEIFQIYEGGLSIHGGILGSILAGMWYTRRKVLNFWQTADLLIPGVILAQAIARIGCDVFGVAMQYNWPWGVLVKGQLLHPVQIYETILDLILFVFLWGLKDRQQYRGQLFVYYLGGYAMIRFILEFARENPMVLGSLTPAHITSLVFLAASIYLGRRLQTNQLAIVGDYHHLWVNGWTWLAAISIAVAGLTVFFAFA